MERKNNKKELLVTILTIICLIITVSVSIIKINTQYSKIAEYDKMEKELEEEIKKAEDSYNKDKSAYNNLNKLQKESAKLRKNNKEEEAVRVEEKINDILGEMSNELRDAISWAEQYNTEIDPNNSENNKIVTPFDKEGFEDDYYSKAKSINQQITENELAQQKIQKQKEMLMLSIFLYIATLIILLINNNYKNGYSLYILIIISFSLATVICGISIF